MLGGVHDISVGIAHVFRRAGVSLIIAYQPSTTTVDTLRMLPEAHLIRVNPDDPIKLVNQLADLSFQTAIISPGWFAHEPFMKTSAEDIDAAFTINFENATYAAQAAAKRLIALNQGGSIIFLSSVVSLMPIVHTNLTGSSLTAIKVIAQMAAVELAPHNIRVNVVAAGWVEGAWSAPLLAENGNMYTQSDIPAGKSDSPASIGNACCFLASPLADYITGIVLPVDGGFLLTKSASKSPYPDELNEKT